jgi:acyl-CoA thioesterase-1
MAARAVRIGLFATLAVAASVSIGSISANASTVVALGASNTYGKGVARSEAYPAQLQMILRARGSSVRVVNAGINGDTTEHMLQRLDGAVPNGTSAVILQPGGNDRRKGGSDRTGDIESRLRARNIPVIMLPNQMLHGLPHQPDGQHLTPAGYHMLAETLASQVSAAIGR